MINIVKKLKSFKAHPNSQDESIFGLIFQSMPYFFSRNGYAFHPHIIYLAINSICNMKCLMCDIGQQDSKTYFYKNMVSDDKSELDLNRLKSLFDEVKHFKPLISITSTEPLLYSNIIEVCDYAINKCGLRVSINTNGYFLDKYIDDFLKIGLNRLVISLDGPPAINDYIRGVKGAFEKVVKTIQHLDKLKKEKNKILPEIAIIFVITNYNYFSLGDFIDVLDNANITKYIFSHMTFITEEMAESHNKYFSDSYPITHSCIGGGIDPYAIDLNVLWSQIKYVKQKIGKKCFFSPTMNYKELYVYYREHQKFICGRTCMIPWGVSQIISNGDVIGLTRCYHKPMGNIYKDDFLKIWNGEALREFRKDIRKYGAFPACSRCRGVL